MTKNKTKRRRKRKVLQVTKYIKILENEASLKRRSSSKCFGFET